jgi:cytoskeletal protein CcmA (bactofilin family)
VVHGDISAENKIEIGVRGKVFGNIQTPRLVTEEGAIFEGSCKMENLGERDPALSRKD